MIHIKNKAALKKMEEAGRLLSSIFDELPSRMKPGVSAAEINSFIETRIKDLKLTSKMKGYAGYKYVSCISTNNEVVHGIPLPSRIFKNGDLVKVDVCISYNGYCADMARPFFIGTVSLEVKKLVEIAFKSLQAGIDQAVPGNRLSDISAAIQAEAEKYGYGVVRDFAGHGIGKQMHEDPEVLNYGKPGKGPVLQVGMAFAIEPMITTGHYDVHIDKDGWTVLTVDNSLAAHVEDTVLITESGPKVVTRGSISFAKE